MSLWSPVIHRLPKREDGLRLALLAGLEIATSSPASASAQSASSPLTPPAGNILFLTLPATGTQNYVCLPVPGQPEATRWVFERPEAALSIPIGGSASAEVTVHALLTVPAIISVPDSACTEAADLSHEYCPAWHSTLDQSTVWGKKVAAEAAGSASDCPNEGALSCLLIKAVANMGATHRSLFADTTFVQRVNTHGGAQPVTGCVTGQIEQVPYSANYNFFRAG